MIKQLLRLASGICLILTSSAYATLFTTTSSTSEGLLSSGFTEIGGIVVDIIGDSGTRVTAQLSASSLYEGYTDNTITVIGTQTGFDTSVTDLLGGGISEIAVRITLLDGDTASGDFDYDDNYFYLNGIEFWNWSDYVAETTDSTGTVSYGSTTGGFEDGDLDTGWFFSDDDLLLESLYTTIISTTSIVYQLFDVDTGDNYLDFTQGIDGALVDVGTGPQTSTDIPEPSSLAILATGLLGFVGYRRRKNK